MSRASLEKLREVLRTIDRPGSFCASGSAPAVLPGLEVEGLGPIGLPLTPHQAGELKGLCERAPYGKGEETLVDTEVRRVWRMKPDRFSLTNPDWQTFLQQTVQKVKQELGLEGQKLESHLYDLLLYEPGSFFLPHRDGEKLARMVATLVIVLPSSFRGGELVVRHEGQEKTIDFGAGADSQYRVHFAAFYADCEHEVRPLRTGHRLCLVYNLTVAKGEHAAGAPRTAGHVVAAAAALRGWAKDDEARKLVVTLDHQYTRDGLTWDALKGVDRVKAHVLLDAARQSACRAHLALLTFYESGSAEYAAAPRSRRRWGEDEEDPSDYEMGEVFDESLTAEHWRDDRDHPLPVGPMAVDQDELLDPEALQSGEPEEKFEGYTGNEGMTLERWYRHAAVILWPERKHFAVVCDAGSRASVAALKPLVERWQAAGAADAAALHAQCLAFAATIIARWDPSGGGYPHRRQEEPVPLLPLLIPLGEPGVIKAYLTQVLARDASDDPGESLPEACRRYGWETFRPELEAVFRATTLQSIERNVRLLEQLCLADPRKDAARAEICTALARVTVSDLESIDRAKSENDYWPRRVDRAAVLTGLALSLLAADQPELLGRLVEYTLGQPNKYPLREAQVAALTALGPWLKKKVKKPNAPLSRWVEACVVQLESLTARAPEAPADHRRDTAVSCKCVDCLELARFLKDPAAPTHRFRVRADRRQHLEQQIHQHKADVDTRTEQTGSPHSLVCTKNTASYQAMLKQFHEDQEHLARLHAIQASLRG